MSDIGLLEWVEDERAQIKIRADIQALEPVRRGLTAAGIAVTTMTVLRDGKVEGYLETSILGPAPAFQPLCIHAPEKTGAQGNMYRLDWWMGTTEPVHGRRAVIHLAKTLLRGDDWHEVWAEETVRRLEPLRRALVAKGLQTCWGDPDGVMQNAYGCLWVSEPHHRYGPRVVFLSPAARGGYVCETWAYMGGDTAEEAKFESQRPDDIVNWALTFLFTP